MSAPVLVISAHLDDGILSAGQFIAGRGDNVDVFTVFSGLPDPGVKTDYDISCGFKDSRDAMAVRRNEDIAACAMLNANPIHTNRLDSQYGDGGAEGLIQDVKKLNAGKKYDMILAPLGLRHPDHITISDMLVDSRIKNLYLYEDLPHRVTHPELVEERIYRHNMFGANLELTFIGDGNIADKVRALWCYRSQLNKGDLNPYNLYVPERFHKI